MTKNQKTKTKKIQLKIVLPFFDQKLQFTCVQENPSAFKREHPALQKMKFIDFLSLWVIFALLDPDTGPGIPLNPDPQHWSAP
jgi:hypothetical protein